MIGMDSSPIADADGIGYLTHDGNCHLIDLVKEYARELEPDNKDAREFLENDLLGFLNRLLGEYNIELK